MGMIVGRDDRRRRVCAVVLAGLLAGTVSVATPGAAANAAAPSVADAGASSLVEIRSTPAADLGLSDLAGVTFDAQSGRLVLADAGVDAVVSVDRAGGSATGTALAGDPNAATLSVDPSADRVTAVDSNRMAAAGTGGGATLTVPLPELVAAEFDQVDGTWVGLTESGNELTIVDRSPAAAGARSTTIDVSAVGSTPLIAVAPNPDDGLIYVLGDVLYAVDEQGAVQRSIPLTDTGLSAPSDMVFAPSSDQTDAPATQSLFVVDNGAQGGSRLVELGLDLAAPMALAAGAFEATLVNTIDMSQLNPPAPDTSGIVYLPAQDRLMVSDSEVEEMSIYQGVNLYKVTRTGSLTDSGTTVSFSQEPTGLGFQASTNTLLVSDDDADRIYKVVPGNDGRHGTGDDSITSVPTSFTGNNDAEDVTYHPDSGHLFVVDGVNKEVYRYQLNGTFVSQFDVGAYGAGDPEGIAFDAATGTFFVLDDASTTIYQVDIDGNLVNTIGIGAAGALKAAGIAVAPASNGSGNRNLYIVDRGIDNDGNPNENDGAIYEMSIPGGGPVNQAPVVNAGVDQLVTAPDTAALVGTASDDGLPDPPATLTTTWSQISGPGTVTFGDASSLSTSASFSAGGVYVLRLTASDSLSSSTDEIEITFVDPNAPSQLNVAIAASTDDAEENNAGGNVNRNSADLELVDDGTVNQTVGLRFVGVNIPDNAVISNAYVQFTVDEVKTAATSLTVRGELSNNAVTYSSPVFNVTSRPDTTASVAWSPPAWSVVGVAGAAQRTPNLSGIVQEIIDQSGWLTGNAVAFTIAGTGVRTARAFDFGSGAAVLHIEYTIGGSPTNQAPVVNAGVDQSVTLPSSAALAGSATDDGLPAPPATVTTTWSQVSGPGTTTFGDASALSTSASFSEAGVYVLRLTASDSALSASDDVQVTVGAAPPGNQAPVVNAGVDQSVTLPTPAALAGSATDDGLPAPPATVTTTWSQVSGPGTTTFGDASSLSTSAAFSVAGVYVLRLTASDSVLSSTDDIQITVNPAAPGNQAP
ncbi:MAG: SdiA-regulated domain-containing protein, partial [Acidimicrobiia bacterium]